MIAADDQHFDNLELQLGRSIDDVSERLAVVRRSTVGMGQTLVERDDEVRRLSGRLRLLRRFGADACLGRVTFSAGGPPLYVGRMGLADETGRRLLVDWRTAAAAPFFAATIADPMGVAARRRYRWSQGRVRDYWDEVLDIDAAPDDTAPDDDSAFLLSLGTARTGGMQDVLATLQADQDAIIRADAHGPLVVDGGPGTGKTVVALHRAAYLLHADSRVAVSRNGILFIGPNEPYLAYVADVLPNIGEDSVQTCTLSDLVPERVTATETDPTAAALKELGGLLAAVDEAVRRFETPPTHRLQASAGPVEVEVTAVDWREAFESADPALTHNDARDEVWETLLELLLEQVDEEEVPHAVARRSLARDEGLQQAFQRAWPVRTPPGSWPTSGRTRRFCAPARLDSPSTRSPSSADSGHALGQPRTCRCSTQRECRLDRSSRLFRRLIRGQGDV